MIKKLAAIAFAVAFSLAAYSPADACPGKEGSKVAEKDGAKDKDKDAKKSKKSTDDKKSKKTDDKKKKESGKKVTRK
jgi:hypothetical protein